MNEKDILIKVEGLSKKFCKDLKTSLWYGIKDLASNVLGNKRQRDLRPKEFWAVKDINFELRRGECLGLIGHNGAGKSTLLKILNGLIKPDEGKVTIKGRVGALIELGAGFNPILSGRENIYNNGAVLGFTRKEIDAKVEEIIDFAEIREFIDMPVQNYSSGMKVRLGFAVAAQMEPDILIIDEVLAVGDVAFRGKCYDTIGKLSKKCVIIFVSHSMSQISRISHKVIYLNKGKIFSIGEVGPVIESYYSNNSMKNDNSTNIVIENKCKLLSFKLSKNELSNYESNLEINLEIESEVLLDELEVDLVLMSRELQPVCNWNSKILNQQVILRKGINYLVISIDNLNLNTGVYDFAITIEGIEIKQKYLWIYNIGKINVIGECVGITPILLSGKIKNR